MDTNHDPSNPTGVEFSNWKLQNNKLVAYKHTRIRQRLCDTQLEQGAKSNA